MEPIWSTSYGPWRSKLTPSRSEIHTSRMFSDCFGSLIGCGRLKHSQARASVNLSVGRRRRVRLCIAFYCLTGCTLFSDWVLIWLREYRSVKWVLMYFDWLKPRLQSGKWCLMFGFESNYFRPKLPVSNPFVRILIEMRKSAAGPCQNCDVVPAFVFYTLEVCDWPITLTGRSGRRWMPVRVKPHAFTRHRAWP